MSTQTNKENVRKSFFSLEQNTRSKGSVRWRFLFVIVKVQKVVAFSNILIVRQFISEIWFVKFHHVNDCFYFVIFASPRNAVYWQCFYFWPTRPRWSIRHLLPRRGITAHSRRSKYNLTYTQQTRQTHIHERISHNKMIKIIFMVPKAGPIETNIKWEKSAQQILTILSSHLLSQIESTHRMKKHIHTTTIATTSVTLDEWGKKTESFNYKIKTSSFICSFVHIYLGIHKISLFSFSFLLTSQSTSEYG